ncbi:MAG: glutamate-1-semialdehyde 2,1-aminomutase [Gammaproteobacteria bacterium]|nr:glutamate-1-semialdehyde 2,1-aminomutase [Gammaproteobacteria bacterium]
MLRSQSKDLFARARKVIPGGVNSPVRAFKGVGGHPIFFKNAKGPNVEDVDGNSYIDYVSSWGPMIQGFTFQPVVNAITAQAQKSTSFGAPTEVEIELAEMIVKRFKSIEKVRMVNSGTEATMSAIRLARGITGRDKIVKFDGCFHGHGDSLLVKAGSGVLTLGLPDSPGVPNDLAQHTISLPFNSIDQITQLFDSRGGEIAAVIVEPIAGNMGCIPPAEGFLETLRKVTRKHKALLIFDEVMTGFRVASAGAQQLFSIEPDLTTLGKVIGAGLPVGAFAGKKKFMDRLAPEGDIYQSGTLSGNPLAMAAGKALINTLDDEFYATLTRHTDELVLGLMKIAAQTDIPLRINHFCGMFSLFFTKQAEVTNFDQVTQCDVDRYRTFFHLMLDEGVYLAPSAFESAFLGGQHTSDVFDQTLTAAENAMRKLHS